jgi:hypothetical protein
MIKKMGFVMLSMLIGVAAFVTSCVRDGDYVSDEPSGASIMFSLKVPEGGKTPTRALSESDESDVRTVDVLLFNKDEGGARVFYKSVSAIPAGTSNGNQKYKVGVPVNDGYTNFDLEFIANASDVVESAGLTVGETKDETFAKLVRSKGSNVKVDKYFPMWGEATNINVLTTNDLVGDNAIKLLRMVSRIDVMVAASAANDDKGNKGANFIMTSVRLYNYSTNGTIVPDIDNGLSTDTNGLYATTPNKPATAGYGTVKGPLEYDVTDSVSIVRTIYTLEAAAGSRAGLLTNTCLVIGGKYQKSNKATYYRIDFTKKESDGSYDYLAMLRNWQYIINITSISGPGFDTPDEAFNSVPVNVEFDILYWHQAGMGNIVFDGTNTLAVDKDDFTLFNNANTDNDDNYMFKVYTDVKAGWTVEKIVDADDNAITWLSATAPQSGVAGAQTPVYLKYEANPSETKERDAYIWIKAARLRFPVHVKQLTIPPIGLEIVDENGDPISEMLFESSLGANPAAKKFTVNWVPKGYTVSVSITDLGSDGGFPCGTAAGIFSGDITDGTGTKTYTVDLPTVTASDIAATPLMDKVSKIDFTISNGGSYISKSIILRQINYDIVISNNDYEYLFTPTGSTKAEHRDSYLLDGKPRTLKVRSNTKWKIKSITEHVYSYSGPNGGLVSGGTMLSGAAGDNLRQGYVGGYNPKGESIVFTPINDPTKWGDMTIVFEDPTGKVADTRTDIIIFALPEVSIYGTGSEVYNPVYATYEHSPRNLMSDKRNFGVDLRVNNEDGTYKSGSRVYDRGMTFSWTNATLVDNATNAKTLAAGLSKCDIYMQGHYVYMNGSAISAEIKKFVTDKGVAMLYMQQDLGNVTPLLNSLGYTNIKNVYARQFMFEFDKNLPADDPIRYGPFSPYSDAEKAKGLAWGEDTGNPGVIYNYSDYASDMVVYTSGSNNGGGDTSGKKGGPFENNGYATGARFLSNPVLWFGDGGWTDGAYPTSATYSAFLLQSKYLPIAKTGYADNAGGYTGKVSNSVIFGNSVVWAISQTGHRKNKVK